MARQQSALPRAEMLVKFLTQMRNFAAQTVEIAGRDVRPCKALQILDLTPKFIDFVFSRVLFHDVFVPPNRTLIVQFFTPIVIREAILMCLTG